MKGPTGNLPPDRGVARTVRSFVLTLQRALLVQQAKQYFARRRQCNRCSVPRTIKDYRSRTVRTVYGSVRLRLPRFNRYQCEPDSSPYVWLGSEYLPNRSTPEWSAIWAALLVLAAALPWKRVSARRTNSLLQCNLRRSPSMALMSGGIVARVCPDCMWWLVRLDPLKRVERHLHSYNSISRVRYRFGTVSSSPSNRARTSFLQCLDRLWLYRKYIQMRRLMI